MFVSNFHGRSAIVTDGSGGKGIEVRLIDSCFRRNPWLLVAGVVASICLSAWSYTVDGIINNDGVHYILTAEHIAGGDWRDALRTFKWPGYPFLIQFVGQLPWVDYEQAAHIVTTAGFTLAVLAFVSVVHALGGRGRVLWMALATILAYPGFNEFRSFVIRDAVYLGFYFLAVAALVRYVASGHARSLAFAACVLALATMFRVEATAVGLLLPMALVLKDGHRVGSRWLPIGVYFLVMIPFLVLFYGWWIYRPEAGESSWTILGRPWHLVQGVLDQLSHEIRDSSHYEAYRSPLLGAVVSAGYAAWLVFRETIEAITLPYLAIVLVEAFKGRALRGWPQPAARLLAVLAAMNVLLLLMFAFTKQFVTPRYPVALATMVVLIVPFALDRYLTYAASLSRPFKRRALFSLFAGLLMINTVEGLDNFTDKEYLREAGLWLREHADSDVKLASNDLKFLYYAQRYGEKWVAFRDEREFRHLIESGQWKLKDYVAANVRRRDPELERLLMDVLPSPPIERFVSEKGDQLLLFRIR